MLLSRGLISWAWTTSATLVAGSTSDGLSLSHQTHRAIRGLGISDTETKAFLGHGLEKATLHRRTQVIQNSTSISKSWQNSVLFRLTSSGLGSGPIDADVTIMCKSCYTTAKVTTSLTFSSHFDATQGIEDATNGVQPITKKMAQNVVDLIESNFQDLGSMIMQDIQDVAEERLGMEMLPYPTLPFDFNAAIASISDITVQHQIDGMEMFLQLETSVSKGATYEINLFASKSQAPLQISDSLFLGVSAELDLIIDAQSAMDMTNGFHVQFNDGLLMEMKLFANTPPHVTFNGGQFEFLPVTITTDRAAMSATLRLGLHTGFIYDNANMSVFGQTLTFQAGMESGVFANVATFSTNVSKSGQNCDLQAAESYQFDVGAAAGANLRAGTRMWGPTPSKTNNILSIAADSVCATKKGSAVVTPALTQDSKAGHAVVTTTTISTTKIFVGQACVSSGLVNCPVSLQTTVTFPTMLTLATALPSGVTPTFPQTVLNSVVSTATFGTQAKNLSPSATSSVDSNKSFLDGSTSGVPNKTIIGVSIGLGVPLLSALVAFTWLYRRHRLAGRGSLRTSLPTSIGSGSRPVTSLNGTTLFNYSSDGAHGIHKESNVTVSVERNYGFR